ncbi:MAG: NifB/NifX family molybdenum-iron cluster-binding protein [Deltaproteobacteria bacterium]|nr:NifB/NifX family molybdenum-iron cluster-binding protein [Deltaproteobacteria bacterium]OQX66111.1 MAG: dinitrogenase iron-molybdenum cofactor biosynthesis protein [Desulfococcus sp. 4484_242]
MKIAVTATGKDMDSEVDPRFGRAAYIVIVDSQTFEFEALDNKENANALKGAGIQAAKTVSDKGAEVLLTGYCGPNAFKAMQAAGVQVANNAEGTVREAVRAYLDGKMPLADMANAEAQW